MMITKPGGPSTPDDAGGRAVARTLPRHGVGLPRTADGRPILHLADLDLDHGGAAARGAGRRRYPCPVHGSDRQRSLSVDLATGLYYCHCCGAAGRLRDYWDVLGPSHPRLVDDGGRRRERSAALVRADRVQAAPVAAPPPAASAVLLASLPALTQALRTPESRGAAYLRGRGLDPALAAALGAGYARAGLWPGDRPGDPGRVVYPLADSETGRPVSLLGRACTEDDGARVRRHRKLPGCPAGLWPTASYARAVRSNTALVLVEGPADALALLACPGLPPVAALGGTRLSLSLAALRRLSGVVLALDDDRAGREASESLRAELAEFGVRHTVVPAGWLSGASDPAGLARAATSEGDQATAWSLCLAEIRDAARSLGSVRPFPPRG